MEFCPSNPSPTPPTLKRFALRANIGTLSADHIDLLTYRSLLLSQLNDDGCRPTACRTEIIDHVNDHSITPRDIFHLEMIGLGQEHSASWAIEVAAHGIRRGLRAHL
jgi:hypothetical protein